MHGNARCAITRIWWHDSTWNQPRHPDHAICWSNDSDARKLAHTMFTFTKLIKSSYLVIHSDTERLTEGEKPCQICWSCCKAGGWSWQQGRGFRLTGKVSQQSDHQHVWQRADACGRWTIHAWSVDVTSCHEVGRKTRRGLLSFRSVCLRDWKLDKWNNDIWWKWLRNKRELSESSGFGQHEPVVSIILEHFWFWIVTTAPWGRSL